VLGLTTLIHIPMLAVVVFAGAQLDDLVQSCAASVGPVTMKAIISVESGGNPLAIDDDTDHRSYSPRTLAQAQAIAARMISESHNFDAGIAQVNSRNFAAQGINAENIFDPCTNVQAGARILGRSYQAAARLLWIGHPPRTADEEHMQEQLALRHAFSIYNSGSAWKSMRYSNLIVAAGLREMDYEPPIRVPGITPFPNEMPAAPATRYASLVTAYSGEENFAMGRMPLARTLQPQPPKKPKPKKPDLETLAKSSDLSPKDF
jgi:type IV secretion system protein VirB1